MTKKTSPAYRASKEETIPINKLHPFSNHPFHIRHDLEFSELVDSISESGIITPIIVRPKVGVGYEVISGHRRWEACKELGIESIPARVEYIDDDEATILMVNSNIQREHVLPSEKAFAYKMRMEALKHQGRTTLAQVGPKFSSEKIAAETGDSRNQVKRYIRLTYLIPSIFDRWLMSKHMRRNADMAEYRYYLIPDAMTRAFPEQFEKQTPTEFFDNIADLEKRYHQLREMPYNNECTWNGRARFPYERLVVGIDRQNPDGAVAIIQVRNGIPSMHRIHMLRWKI